MAKLRYALGIPVLGAALCVTHLFGGSAAAQDGRPDATEGASPSRQTVPDLISLTVGFADIFRVDGEVATVILGEPAIAEASPLDAHSVLINPMASGTTNLILLDEEGGVVADLVLRVSSRVPGTVTVRRALETQAYSCATGLCEGPSSAAGSPAAPAPSPVADQGATSPRAQ